MGLIVKGHCMNRIVLCLAMGFLTSSLAAQPALIHGQPSAMSEVELHQCLRTHILTHDDGKSDAYTIGRAIYRECISEFRRVMIYNSSFGSSPLTNSSLNDPVIVPVFREYMIDTATQIVLRWRVVANKEGK
jgi:hypothetical protein